MPISLKAPKKGRTPFWRIRGSHLGVRVDQSTKTSDRKLAAKILAAIKSDIERGSYARPGDPTFAGAAIAYMEAGGERRFVNRLLDHFGTAVVATITQSDIDAAAVSLYPRATAATRNRQVYSPMSAILKRAGVEKALKRPAGARGQSRLTWLRPEEAIPLLEGAAAVDPRFGALCTFLLYTGCRLSEALRLRPCDLSLDEGFAYIPQTKNGDPRPAHLPPVVTAALANLQLDRSTVFALTKCGRLYTMLARASEISGVEIPNRVSFHIFRHTYGAWMRRYAGLDTTGLLATRAWKSRQAAAVYEHADVTAEARKADLLPTRANGVRKAENNKKVK